MYHGRLETLNDAVCLNDLSCPHCGQPAEDLRSCGFRAQEWRDAKRCYWFNRGSWECNSGLPGIKQAHVTSVADASSPAK